MMQEYLKYFVLFFVYILFKTSVLYSRKREQFAKKEKRMIKTQTMNAVFLEICFCGLKRTLLRSHDLWTMDNMWPLDWDESFHGNGECGVHWGGESHVSQGQQNRQHHRQDLEEIQGDAR